MEGLKNMAAKAMADDPECVHCHQPLEPGNTGTVCNSCTMAMFGGAAFAPLGTMAGDYMPANPNNFGASKLTPNSQVGIGINGRDVHVTAYRTLQGWADDITNSLLPDEVALLVRLLTGPAKAETPWQDRKELPESFWRAIQEGQKIPAIKELRAASDLDLRGSKKIVDAIMSKDKSECDKCDKDEPEGEPDKDESEKDESEDKPEDEPDDKDQAKDGDESQESDEGKPSEDGEPEDADYGQDAEGNPGDSYPAESEAAAAAEAELATAAETGEGSDSDAIAGALADLARQSIANGKEYGEDEIKKALSTLGIQF